MAPARAGETKAEKEKTDPSWARWVLSPRNLGLGLRESGFIWDVLSRGDICAQELWAAIFHLMEQEGKGTAPSLGLFLSEVMLPHHPRVLGGVPMALS